MWKDDNNKLQNLFSEFLKIGEFPHTCPICGNDDAHIYMHRYNQKTLRGGLWVWCSQCNSFSHSSIFVPDYWENCSSVVLENLSAIPCYLDDIKTKLDEHANYILKNKKSIIG